jgi:hypothetical protein
MDKRGDVSGLSEAIFMRSIGIIAGAGGILLAALWGGMAGAQPAASATEQVASNATAKPKPKPRHHSARQTSTEAAPATGGLFSTFNARASEIRFGAPQIFLLKGLADVFSSGMDKLQGKLSARGIDSVVASHAASDRLADEVAARYRAGDHAPIIIVGHSLGADAAVTMSQRLNDARVPVALVVTFGPVGFPRVMGNVSRAVNFYQANSAWHGQIVRGPGFRGSLTNIDLENAVDINHFNIEKADRLQARAISQIVAVLGRRHAPAKPAATAGGAHHAKPETGSAGAPGQKAASGEPAAQQN